MTLMVLENAEICVEFHKGIMRIGICHTPEFMQEFKSTLLRSLSKSY
jgi:hypothetical protein